MQIYFIQRSWKPLLSGEINPVEQSFLGFADKAFVISGSLFLKAPIQLGRNLPVDNDYRLALERVRVAWRDASENGWVFMGFA